MAVTRLGTKSLTLDYAVRDSSSGSELATARTVLVAYDYLQRESIAIPAEWRRAIEAFENPKE